jgi:CheY-like chemotaxis protein
MQTRQPLNSFDFALAFKAMEQSGNVLLVDDNDDDAFFIEKAFKTAGCSAHIFRCIDGRETQNYLEGKSPFEKRGFFPIPDLILLDLKIPQMSGIEVLQWIRAHPTLHNLIVIILTSSAQQRDIDEAYALLANCFLTKPSSLTETVEMARAIKQCWLQNLPTPPAPARV